MAARLHVDFQMIALKERFAIPEGWQVYSWELKNFGTSSEYIEFSGAVVTEVFKRGPRKGRKNWAKKNRLHDMSFPLRKADIDAAKERWSLDTGKCSNCTGNGTEWRGWSAAEGDRFDTCRRCGGTGQRTAEAAA